METVAAKAAGTERFVYIYIYKCVCLCVFQEIGTRYY